MAWSNHMRSFKVRFSLADCQEKSVRHILAGLEENKLSCCDELWQPMARHRRRHSGEEWLTVKSRKENRDLSATPPGNEFCRNTELGRGPGASENRNPIRHLAFSLVRPWAETLCETLDSNLQKLWGNPLCWFMVSLRWFVTQHAL